MRYYVVVKSSFKHTREECDSRWPMFFRCLIFSYDLVIFFRFFLRRGFIEINKQYLQDSVKERHKEHSVRNNEERERETQGSHNIHLCQIIWDRSD